MRNLAIGLFAVGAAVALRLVAVGQTPTVDPTTSAACTALANNHSFEQLAAAPAWVMTATVVTPPTGAPYCEVFAHVAQQVGVQIRLPLDHWNGKFWMNGNHGLGGVFVIGETDIPLSRGYAVAAGDMGHHSRPNDAGWAYHSMQGKIDFGYRATHVATVAAKAIVTAFYGKPIRIAYFGGWSTGGRMALMEAERYPNDFNGIVAGPAPLWSSEMQGTSLLWTEKANRDAAGHPILTVAALKLLHDGATAACDGGDGVHDGLIPDPRTCHWDPGALQCGANAAPDSCLTAAQVATARKFYEAPHDSAGHPLYPGGMMRGSELSWTDRMPYGTSPISRTAEFSLAYLRYLAFDPDAGPKYDLFSYNFDRDPQRLATYARIYDATNPDLRPFFAHGGKLIIYSGWADEAMPPLATVKFYEQIVQAVGGHTVADRSVRLFMIPGQYHDPVGVGPTATIQDVFPLLEAWVETNTPPDHFIAKESRNGAVVRTRPVFAYPLIAHYTGSGDVNDAANFVPR